MCQKDKILSKLNEQRITQRSIADYLKVSPTLVANVIHGRARSAKVETVLTKLTGFNFPKNRKVRTELTELLGAK